MAFSGSRGDVLKFPGAVVVVNVQCIGVSGWSSEKALWQSKYLVECDFNRTAAFAVNFHQYIFFYRIASSDDVALRCPLLKSLF